MLLRHFTAALLAALIPMSCGPAGAALLKAAGGGTVHALVIGINQYPRLVGHSLRGARQDAEDIAAALARDGVTDLTLVRDQEATRARIVNEIDRLVATSKSGDLVILTYAGHGMQTPEYPRWHGIDKNGVNEQIALSGFDFTGPGAGEVIVNEEVRAWLSRLDEKDVDTLIAWDSCFGGGMRSVAPGGDEIRIRQVQGSPEEEERKKFVGISMTAKEERADVRAMSHVTFLAGATRKSVVPEMTGVDPHDRTAPRGALSYFLARALDGELKSGADISRAELFPFLKQGVGEATAGRQAIQVDPQSEDRAISDRTVFVLEDVKEPVPEPTRAPCSSPDPNGKADPVEPVCVAVINGPADAAKSIEKGGVPLTFVAEPSAAELIWNVGAKLAIAQSDTLMENVDGSLIGAIADRVRTLTLLRTIGAGRPLLVSLESGGALLKEGQTAKINVDDLRGEHLTVINIGADAMVQMLYPSAPNSEMPCHAPDPAATSWQCRLVVTQPFGADTVVAITTSREPAALYEWLRQHEGRRDALGFPAMVQTLLADDAAARIGFVPVVTHARDN